MIKGPGIVHNLDFLSSRGANRLQVLSDQNLLTTQSMQCLSDGSDSLDLRLLVLS